MAVVGKEAMDLAGFVEPVIGPKLAQLYHDQDARGVGENYDSNHLRDYKQYASLAPIPDHVLQKGRHRQVAGHDACSSCHFCRQCTEDIKPRCATCGKSFCGPCLANRFGQNAHEMLALASWSCPVCLDFCNCSGSNCRRARLRLEPTASLIHEAQAFGYSSVAEYLLVTALFREGSKEEARRALEWLANPDRQFTERAVRQSSAHRGIQIHHAASGKHTTATPSASTSTGAAGRKRSSVTAEERISRQIGHLTTALGFHTLESLASQVQAFASELPTAVLAPAAPARQAPAQGLPARAPHGPITPTHSRPAHGAPAHVPPGPNPPTHRRLAHGPPAANAAPGSHVRRLHESTGADAAVVDKYELGIGQLASWRRLQRATGDATCKTESLSGRGQAMSGDDTGSAAHTNSNTVRRKAGIPNNARVAPEHGAGLLGFVFTPSWVHVSAETGSRSRGSTGAKSELATADTLPPSAGCPTLAQRCTGAYRSSIAARLWQQFETSDHGICGGRSAAHVGAQASGRRPVGSGDPGRHPRPTAVAVATVSEDGRANSAENASAHVSRGRPAVCKDPGQHPRPTAGASAAVPDAGKASSAGNACAGALGGTSTLGSVVNADPELPEGGPVQHHTEGVTRTPLAVLGGQAGDGSSAVSKSAAPHVVESLAAPAHDAMALPVGVAMPSGALQELQGTENVVVGLAKAQGPSVAPQLKGAENAANAGKGEAACLRCTVETPTESRQGPADTCKAVVDDLVAVSNVIGGCVATGPAPNDAEAVLVFEALCTHTATLAARGMAMRSAPAPLAGVLESIATRGQCMGDAGSWAAEPGALCQPVLDSAVAQLRAAQKHLSAEEAEAVEKVLTRAPADEGSARLLRETAGALVDRSNDLLGEAYSAVLRATEGGAVVEVFRDDNAEATLALGTAGALVDRSNDLLGEAYSAVLLAAAWFVVVDVFRDDDAEKEGKEDKKCQKHINLTELAALLSIFKRHVTSFWPHLKRSHLDAKVLRRLVGLEKFVDFQGSDPASRGLIIRTGLDMVSTLHARFLGLLRAALSQGSALAAQEQRWLEGEQGCAWRALALVSRGLLSWGGILQQEWQGLQSAWAPGFPRMMLQASEKPGLLRANQDACTMLLGTLMLHVVSSLRKHRQELEVMVDPEAEYTGDAAATFISAAVDVITVLPPNQSTCGFWESLLALGASSLNRTSTMLLPLTASALANAAFVLATLLEIAPAPSLPLAARLAPCTKALAQSLKAAEALLATLQASILVNGSDATATRSAQIQEAKANHCAVTGALIGALHRRGLVPLTAALHMCGFREDDPVATLGPCALRSARATQHTSLLLTLCRDNPASLLDLDTSDTPPAFSMRWVLVMGSICDLCMGPPPHRAPFWTALVTTVSSPRVAGRVGLLGGAPASNNDVVSWAKWLAVAALSGLLQEELALGPEVLSHALAACFGAADDASLPQATLPRGFKDALALVRGTDVLASGHHLSAAALLACLMTHAAPGRSTIWLHSIYATLTAAAVQSVPELLRTRCPSATSSSSGSSAPLVTAAAVAERTHSHRQAVRASLLSGTTSLCTLLTFLLGTCRPFDLLGVPPDLHSQQSGSTPGQPLLDLAYDLLEGILSCLPLCSVPTILSASSRCVLRAPADPASAAPAGPLSSDSALLSTAILEELAASVASVAGQDGGGAPAHVHAQSPGQTLWLCVERSVERLLSRASSGQPDTCQAAANAVALMRLIAAHQATNAIANHNTAVAATLLPVLQHCTRPGTPAAILLPQIELLELTRTSLRGTSYLPAPSPEGIDQPGPPRGGLVSESLSWYLVQQSLLCGLQALTDLLQLPSVVLKFIQQQLTGEGVVWAIDSSRPGHCIWQLKKLLGCSAPAPAAPGTVNLDGAPRAHWEAHDLQWTLVSSLLRRDQEDLGNGLLWTLVQHGSPGIAWVMHAAPRLGWLLAAGEALHCGASVGGNGESAQIQRSALAAVLKTRLAWARRQFDELLEELFMVHMQSVSALGAAQIIPNDIVAAARAASAVEIRPPARNVPMQPCPPPVATLLQPRGLLVQEESSSCAASQNIPPQRRPTLMPAAYAAAHAAASPLTKQRRVHPENDRDVGVKRARHSGSAAPEGSCASTPHSLPTVRISGSEDRRLGSPSRGAASLMPTQPYTQV